jgi:hypothetical protein
VGVGMAMIVLCFMGKWSIKHLCEKYSLNCPPLNMTVILPLKSLRLFFHL